MINMNPDTQTIYNLLPKKSRIAINWLIIRFSKGETEQLIVNCHEGSVANIQDKDKTEIFI